MVFLSLLLALVILGCGSRPTEAPIAVETQPTQAPRERWADFYGGPVADVTLSSLEEKIWEGATQGKRHSCVLDPRLTLVAREHAAALAASSRAPRDDDLDRLRFTLMRLGGTDYALQPLFTVIESSDFEDLYVLIEKSGANSSHCGVGVGGSGQRQSVVWLGVDRKVTLNRLPTQVPSGTTISLSGQLLTHTREKIQLFVGLPDGRVKRLRPTQPSLDGRFQVATQLKQAGRYEVELLINRGRGPETAVLLPVFVGVSRDPRPLVAPDLSVTNDERSPEEKLFTFLNAARRRLGLSPLKRDKRLDAVARAHSKDMAAGGFFGHLSPVQGTLQERLDSSGLSPVRSAENLARSPSVYRMHRNLMGSPSHRINTLDPGFTHVGVGVVQDGNSLIATEIFACF